MFGQPVNDKDRLLEQLERAVADLREGHIELRGAPVFVSAPQASDVGLTSDRQANFFGFAFTYSTKVQKSSPVTPPTPTFTEPNENVRPALKCTNREVDSMKTGLEYVCPCGFQTSSATGIKKHANRCDDWAKRYRP